MRLIKLILGIAFSILTYFFIQFLSEPQTIGEGREIPPVGNLMNPFSGVWANAEPTTFVPEQNMAFDALDGEVNVHYDERMVPHIFADNTKDALFVQGYVTASQRYFQMDISVRSTAGRLSEVLGESILDRDLKQRRKGMVFAAENAVREWMKNEESKELLGAYVDGVNAYVNSLSPADYPLEYKLMGFEPEEWSILKTAIFVKAMAYSLAGRHLDIEATNSLKRFTKDTFDYLYPEYFKEETPIVPIDRKNWAFKAEKVADDKIDNDIDSYFDYKNYDNPPAGLGSNNWVVSGSKTKSGDPILCGDPHLGLTLPSIWYEMQINTPELNAYGVTLPGIPFVIIGFNEFIAWTQTNVGHDVTDLYQMTWKDKTKMEYLYDGEYKKVELRVDEYQVKGLGTIRDTVRYTVWGPVTYENPNGMEDDLAYQWLGHHGSDKNEITTFYELNKARNFDEYYKALNTYNVPAQNYAFASREGDIALRVMGKYPLKEEGQGRFVRDGSLSSSGWKGFIPKEHVPFVKNPPQGFVSSANQHSTDPSYPYYYNKEKFEAFRGRIANRLLSEKEVFTVQDMMDMQNSNYCLKSEEAFPLMMQYLDEAEQSANPGVMTLLKNWDYTYRSDSKAATFFNAWWSNLHNEDLWDEMETEPYPLMRPSWIRTIHLMRDVPESIFFDDRRTDEAETINDIVTKSFKKAIKEFGDDIPKWSDFQNPTIYHITRSIPAFNRTPEVGGVHSALNAQTHVHGPSWRQIVVLGDEVKAFVSYPGGQSGNPGSKYYDDFLDTWANGKYYEAMFMISEDDHAEGMIARQIYSKK